MNTTELEEALRKSAINVGFSRKVVDLMHITSNYAGDILLDCDESADLTEPQLREVYKLGDWLTERISILGRMEELTVMMIPGDDMRHGGPLERVRIEEELKRPNCGWVTSGLS